MQESKCKGKIWGCLFQTIFVHPKMIKELKKLPPSLYDKKKTENKIKEPIEYMKCNHKEELPYPKYTWEVDSYVHIDGSTSYSYYWRKVK